MPTKQITADSVQAGQTISASFAGVIYRGVVRSVDPAVFTTRHTGVDHRLITFVGGGYFPGSDCAISIPATETVELI